MTKEVWGEIEGYPNHKISRKIKIIWSKKKG